MSSPYHEDGERQLSLSSSSTTASPPSLPLFSASSNRTSTSNSKLFSKISQLGGNRGSSAANAGEAAKAKRHHQPRRKQAQDSQNRALCKRALIENDAMVYLEAPQVYTCGNCRTHLTSHDDIISKSFHGRHGRAYLFDQCVNITTGPSEDRLLMTGLHSVCDISCKRCHTLIGWTYVSAYERSQKYKEGKFIIEKMFLYFEESGHYDIDTPAGEKVDKWRKRSMSWGSERSLSVGSYAEAKVMGSPLGVTSPGAPSYASVRGGGSSIAGSSGTNRNSPGVAMLSPKSTPGDGIIYEYR